MPNEVLTVAQSYEADRYAQAHGVASLTLMENAGRAVAEEICKRWSPRPIAVLCGPGGNGGDGYVVARVLRERGWAVTAAALGERANLKGDAAAMAARWTGPVQTLQETPDAELYVDALFGAGLSKPLTGEAARFARDTLQRRVPVVAVDVPSGLHGDRGRGLDDAIVHADLTVTFFRKKPAHLLMPGREFCGE
ncbi:MAG: NAD(P)H-hydrate epimerase, partial [Alphaproteobacteria bacterium]|nr:NAD(P)H-hydrate epimerase [Alphaproteobacteria bacterium]